MSLRLLFKVTWTLFLRAGWVPLLVFTLHGVFSYFRLYHCYKWSDVPMHFFGGVVIAFFFSTCFQAIPEETISRHARSYFELIYVFGLTAAAAVFWEFGEYVFDTFLGTGALGNVYDTLQDLALGISGGLTYILITWWLGRAGRVKPIDLAG